MRCNVRILGALLIFSMVACAPAQVKEQTATNAEISDVFVKKMHAGGTSRKQEQEFIETTRINWHAQDFNINGTALPPDVAAVLSLH